MTSTVWQTQVPSASLQGSTGQSQLGLHDLLYCCNRREVFFLIVVNTS